MELEGQGREIIMGLTRLLLLGPIYNIAINGQPKQIYRQNIWDMVATAFAIQAILDLEDCRGLKITDRTRHFSNILVKRI